MSVVTACLGWNHSYTITAQNSHAINDEFTTWASNPNKFMTAVYLIKNSNNVQWAMSSEIKERFKQGVLRQTTSKPRT